MEKGEENGKDLLRGRCGRFRVRSVKEGKMDLGGRGRVKRCRREHVEGRGERQERETSDFEG